MKEMCCVQEAINEFFDALEAYKKTKDKDPHYCNGKRFDFSLLLEEAEEKVKKMERVDLAFDKLREFRKK